jgi:hypothetical protein
MRAPAWRGVSPRGGERSDALALRAVKTLGESPIWVTASGSCCLTR